MFVTRIPSIGDKVIRKYLEEINRPLTEEQKKMLEEMNNRPVCPDEDCPELTEEQLSQMKRVNMFSRC